MERIERVSLGSILGERLRGRSEVIAAEWLARLLERLPEQPHDIFPDRNLLNHVPELVERISLSLSSQAEVEELLSAEILHELRLLAQLRRAQGYDLKELLIELEVLGEVVTRHVIEVMADMHHDPPVVEGVRVAGRLQRVLFAMGLVASEVFLQDGARQRLRRTEILASFARAVTHEVKNRTHPALLGVNLAREHLASGRVHEADEALARVESNLQNIDALPMDLLGVSLGQNRQLAFPIRREDLGRVMRRSVNSLSPYASVHGVALRIEGEAPDLRVDAGRIQLVLVNLIGNGIKYRDLDKPDRWVVLRALDAEGTGRVRVDVEDNGVGIPQEQIGRIFDDRVRAQGDGPYDGGGLGLALAHEALLQIGSQLHIESQIGCGTHFSFRLPIDAELEPAPPSPARGRRSA